MEIIARSPTPDIVGRSGFLYRAAQDFSVFFLLLFSFYSPTIGARNSPHGIDQTPETGVGFHRGLRGRAGLLPEFRGDCPRAAACLAGHRPQTHFRAGSEELPEARVQPEPLA